MTLEKVEEIIKDYGDTFKCCEKESIHEFFPYEDLETEWLSGKSLTDFFEECYWIEDFRDYGCYINPKYDNNLPPLSEVEIWYGYVENKSLDLYVLKYNGEIIAAEFSID